MPYRDKAQFAPVSYQVTHPGKVRALNEDNLVCDDRRGVWAVADGMGGYSRGDHASAVVVKHLSAVRGQGWPTPKALALDVISRLEDANGELLADAERTGAGTIGSTVACLLVFRSHALAIWCGDSRIYRLRRSEPIQRISHDHTLVQELVDAGHLTDEEAETHPNAHLLTHGLGVEGRFKLESRQLTLRDGDRFIICSDGLTRTVTDTEIAQLARRELSPVNAGNVLMMAALDAGAPDNVTIVTVDFREIGRG